MSGYYLVNCSWHYNVFAGSDLIRVDSTDGVAWFPNAFLKA